MSRLLDVLREELRLTGTRKVAEKRVRRMLRIDRRRTSKLVPGPVLQVDGASITTIEGLPGPLQRAFIEHGAPMRICTPGMILAAFSLLNHHPSPTLDQIANPAGNLCRCTGYMRIFEASPLWGSQSWLQAGLRAGFLPPSLHK